MLHLHFGDHAATRVCAHVLLLLQKERKKKSARGHSTAQGHPESNTGIKIGLNESPKQYDVHAQQFLRSTRFWRLNQCSHIPDGFLLRSLLHAVSLQSYLQWPKP